MISQQETPWRESASLILVSKIDTTNRLPTIENNSYKLLFQKRSDRTAVFQNQAVFPGGIFDAADQSVEWLKYFQLFGVKEESLRSLIILNDERPKLLLAQGNGCYDRFFKKSQIWAREISLRITAIRETFEEVGILLCRKYEQLDCLNHSGTVYFFEDFDKRYWQSVVHKDPKQFLELCRQHRVVPDLWGLYEWSAWASPAAIGKRYETVFFIAFINKPVKTLSDSSEVKELMWQTPKDLMRMNQTGEFWIMPPQLYELSRLVNIQDFDNLVDFARIRSLKGITLFLPVGYLCSDGLVTVLPGDDMYPQSDPRKFTSFTQINLSIEEFRAKAEHIHRLETTGENSMKFLMNVKPYNGHLPILQFNKNKL